jgi:hypothetical protein
MNSARQTGFHIRTMLAAALVAGLVATATAQAPATPVRYTATATNIDPAVALTATTIQITVNRWSTDAEHEQLLNVASGGQAKLLRVLQGMPRAGTIGTRDSVGDELRYARQTATENGGSQVTLITDRPLSFFEASNRERSADYPFMVVDLRLNPNGSGEGTITVATKITASAKTRHMILENYGSQPVRLTKVSRVD